jgi:hypothetical protein
MASSKQLNARTYFVIVMPDVSDELYPWFAVMAAVSSMDYQVVSQRFCKDLLIIMF